MLRGPGSGRIGQHSDTYIFTARAGPVHAKMLALVGIREAGARAVGSLHAWYDEASMSPCNGSSIVTLWYTKRGRWTFNCPFAMQLAMDSRKDKSRMEAPLPCIRIELWVVSVLAAMYAIVGVFLAYSDIAMDVAIMMSMAYTLLALVLSNEVFINMGIPTPRGTGA